MAIRTSTDTYYTENTRTRCPYCNYLLDFQGGYFIGDTVICHRPKCKKKFIVGEEG